VLQTVIKKTYGKIVGGGKRGEEERGNRTKSAKHEKDEEQPKKEKNNSTVLGHLGCLNTGGTECNKQRPQAEERRSIMERARKQCTRVPGDGHNKRGGLNVAMKGTEEKKRDKKNGGKEKKRKKGRSQDTHWCGGRRGRDMCAGANEDTEEQTNVDTWKDVVCKQE